MNIDILVCTIDDNINKVSKVLLPVNPSINYIISWQRTNNRIIELPKSLERKDVFIVELEGRGLSRNRNNALKHATSDICLIADDDVEYNINGVKSLINYYENNPEVDVVTYKFTSRKNAKKHPDFSFELKHAPKGYNVSSIEISFRREKIQGIIQFNELMGLGSPFSGSGEDNLFILDCLAHRLNCRYIPINVVHHEEESTGRAQGGTKKVVFARGILTRIYNPYLYPLKYIWLARSIKINHDVGFLPTLLTLFKGGIYARKNGMLKYNIKKIFS